MRVAPVGSREMSRNVMLFTAHMNCCVVAGVGAHPTDTDCNDDLSYIVVPAPTDVAAVV